MDTSELIKKVRRIEIKTKGLSNQVFAGSYHSSFKGHGVSFSEVREYSYGDDVRHIDWNVTARSGSPYIKVYDEERELTVMLLIDVSQSMNFGIKSVVKKEIAAEIAAIISFSAINNNDKVGAIFFSDTIECYLPPKKGKKNILRIIREIINIEPANKGSNLGEALKYFTNVQKKRSITFVLSDFMSPDFELPLSLAAQKHDIIGINLYDPSEHDIPDMGIVHLYDAENHRTLYIDTSDENMVKSYKQKRAHLKEAMERMFVKLNSDCIHVDVSRDYIKSLIGFFKKRK